MSRRRFGIKNGRVVDLYKKTEYPILRTIPYRDGTVFVLVTKKQSFLKQGLWVW